MLTKIKAIFYLQSPFFLIISGIVLVPYILIKTQLPQLQGIHIYFFALLFFLVVAIPRNSKKSKAKIKKFLHKNQAFSHSQLIQYGQFLSLTRTIFFAILAIIISLLDNISL